MTCCGCDDDSRAATGWKRFIPALAGATIVSAMIAAAVVGCRDRTGARHGATG